MRRLSLEDGSDSVEVTLFEAAAPARVVLFSVGLGGDPGRHLALLTSLAERGCTVVAPHFERLASAVPTLEELSLRARRLKLALDSATRPGVPAVGVGHSIGATMLLGLVGGQVWTRSGHRLTIPVDERIDRLVLLAPATDFFQVPGALDAVQAPVLLWAGTRDEFCSPARARALEQALARRAPVEVRLVNGAGHFSFMNAPPPNTVETLPDREAFLAELSADVCRFVAR